MRRLCCFSVTVSPSAAALKTVMSWIHEQGATNVGMPPLFCYHVCALHGITSSLRRAVAQQGRDHHEHARAQGRGRLRRVPPPLRVARRYGDTDLGQDLPLHPAN